MSTERFCKLTEKEYKQSKENLGCFNTPSSNPDYTVGFGVSPNQHFRTRGLYRRSGISPCPEDIFDIQLFVSLYQSNLIPVNKSPFYTK